MARTLEHLERKPWVPRLVVSAREAPSVAVTVVIPLWATRSAESRLRDENPQGTSPMARELVQRIPQASQHLEWMPEAAGSGPMAAQPKGLWLKVLRRRSLGAKQVGEKL